MGPFYSDGCFGTERFSVGRWTGKVEKRLVVFQPIKQKCVRPAAHAALKCKVGSLGKLTKRSLLNFHFIYGQGAPKVRKMCSNDFQTLFFVIMFHNTNIFGSTDSHFADGMNATEEPRSTDEEI